MKKTFHIALLASILVIFLYLAVRHSGMADEKCNQEWQMNFIDDPSPLSKVGILLIK